MLSHGVGIRTVMALIIGDIEASMPEFSFLLKLFKKEALRSLEPMLTGLKLNPINVSGGKTANI